MTATTEPVSSRQPPVAALPLEVCAQMSRAYPLGADSRTVRVFAAPAGAAGAYAHSVAADARQQILIVAGRHPYELMTDAARRIASRALKESEYSNMGMSPTGAIFAMLADGTVLRDAGEIAKRQGECLFGRAFLLTPSSL